MPRYGLRSYDLSDPVPPARPQPSGPPAERTMPGDRLRPNEMDWEPGRRGRAPFEPARRGVRRGTTPQRHR
ncbi:MAG TPA: hypothetical protein PKA20_02950 [Burkholderiaceae bacterium]|nr:hypothetical protein [Burkholderiaceae bacterium]